MVARHQWPDKAQLQIDLNMLIFGYIFAAMKLAGSIPAEVLKNEKFICTPMKIRNLIDLFTILPEDERIIVDVLRQIVIETLPEYCKEKISYNVPFFYGNKGICIIWPSTVPRGGIKKGVLFGFWYGNRLKDPDRFLSHGTNKQIFYRIYETPEEIDERPIKKLLKEAIELDRAFKKAS